MYILSLVDRTLQYSRRKDVIENQFLSDVLTEPASRARNKYFFKDGTQISMNASHGVSAMFVYSFSLTPTAEAHNSSSHHSSAKAATDAQADSEK